MEKERKKKEIWDFGQMKKAGEKITYLTAYTYPIAQFCEKAGLDMLLVGDSLFMCIYGYPDTIHTGNLDKMKTMLGHTNAVRRGAPNTFIIGDMPYGSYQVSVEEAIKNAQRFIEAGADAIKLEGGERVIGQVWGMREAGMAVMAHLGFTPQSSDIDRKSPKVAGRTAEEAKEIIEDALLLEDAGVFAILLEAVPPEIGKIITEKCKVPVLGIGAGPHTDGQLLIVHDILKLFTAFKPKFIRHYADLEAEIIEAAGKYADEVRSGRFPNIEEHCYRMFRGEEEKLKEVQLEIFGGPKITTDFL